MPAAVANRKTAKTSQSRVFTIRNRAGPGNVPVYQTLMRAQAPSWPQGDITQVEIPDPDAYEQFIVVDEIVGQQGLPTIGLQARFTRDLSELLKLTRERCPFDIQIHFGACRNPSDFNEGWLDGKILVFEGGRISSWDGDELGALDSGQNAAVNETIAVSAREVFEIKSILGTEVAASAIVQEVVSVAICDSKTCGECGLSSDGCQRVFAVTLSAGGSPGLAAEVVYSDDGGATWTDTNITTLAANEDPNDMACVGTNLVVISEDSESLHYAPIADILTGTETWTEVTTGFVAAKGPLAIFSLGRTFTWIAAEGGYIYFSDDIESDVEVQSAGSVTTNNLNAIHGIDILNLVAVGNTNTVLYTTNGGDVWTSVTGPAVGVNLTAVWVRSSNEWLVGDANGRLWYTTDTGASWTQKGFPGQADSVEVSDIHFPKPTVGYMAHADDVLRTIDGGNSWYRLPEGTATFPSNTRVNAVIGCEEDVNLVYGGGLAVNGTDGFLVKVA